MLDFVQKMNDLGRAKTPFLFILDYALNNPIVLPLSSINPLEISYSFGALSNDLGFNYPKAELEFNFTPPTQQKFEKAFQQIQDELHAGNTYLTNLCFRSAITCNWDLKTIFAQASAKYKLRYKDDFVFFSPETFVKIKDGFISAFPMKGTIDASLPDAKELLLQDPKESAEHATIVDLLRNDLSIVAEKVRLKNYKYLDLLTTNRGDIWQMSSEIQGALPTDYTQNIGSIIAKLLPAGSISGAPKKKTIEIIEATETIKRGYYTGVAGIFDGAELDSSVMIRFIEKEKNKYYYRSGGGITAQSQCKKEYEELKQKIYIPNQNTNVLLVETIRLKNGEFENVDWHQKRMNSSRLDVFGIEEPIQLADRLDISNYNFEDKLIRCRVLYGKQIKQIEFIPYTEKKISSLQLVQLPKISTNETQYKWANRSLYQYLLSQKKESDDVLIVRDGTLTDTSICNIALWDGQQWWTPKKPLLEGTMRARLLSKGILKERIIKSKDLSLYSKIRLFNAMIPWSLKRDISCDALHE